MVGALIATATTRPSPTGRPDPRRTPGSSTCPRPRVGRPVPGRRRRCYGRADSAGPTRTSATLVVGEPTTLDPARPGRSLERCRDLASCSRASRALIRASLSGRRSPRPGTSPRAARGSCSIFGRACASPTAHPSTARMSSAAGCGSSTRSIPRRSCRFSATSKARSTMPADAPATLEVSGSMPRATTSRSDSNQPSPDFPSVVAGSSFAVVPPGVGTDPTALLPDEFVSSGAYLLSAISPDGLTLKANEHYWAGAPAIPTIQLLVTLHGKSPVSEFEAGNARLRADRRRRRGLDRLRPDAWPEPARGALTWDDVLRLRHDASAVQRRAGPPCVRRRRSTGSASFRWPARPRRFPANSMIPRAFPGHPSRDFSPAFDPAAAKAALAEAGYPDGTGFPHITLVHRARGIDEGIVTQLKANLGIDVGYEVMEANFSISAGSRATFRRSGPQLGRRLPGRKRLPRRSPGEPANRTITAAGRRRSSIRRWPTPASRRRGGSPGRLRPRAGDRRSATCPLIPVSYGTGWALARTGLLGAGQNGLGVPRLAGLAWDATP